MGDHLNAVIANPKKRPAVESQFWGKVDVRDENSCWRWRGGTLAGYGVLNIKGQVDRVQRIVYALVHGPIPKGARVERLCPNKTCCNPWHVVLRFPVPKHIQYERRLQVTRDWGSGYRPRTREKRRKAQARHRRSPHQRLKGSLRTRLRYALFSWGRRKTLRTMSVVGCSVAELKQHLESLWLPGMSWDNYGTVWHIDHIIPCAYFDLTREDHQRVCFNWENLRPLWAEENIRKQDKLVPEAVALLESFIARGLLPVNTQSQTRADRRARRNHENSDRKHQPRAGRPGVLDSAVPPGKPKARPSRKDRRARDRESRTPKTTRRPGAKSRPKR